ncbi:MAG: hypothetical protein DDT42_01742 [candidate division WS2 bacterium]|uniref:Uncharacterized protein n=1 Tax=Psychracetigena formicireducens TaxID=2986056 RepID=A0A9E2BHU7_PSYF1|nr:hypothetical protein [Candidatus Psychracetigena formicireducens]
MGELYAIQDETERDKRKKDLEKSLKNKKEGTTTPILSIGIDERNNNLRVGLRKLNPEYIEAITEVVGRDVPIHFYEEGGGIYIRFLQKMLDTIGCLVAYKLLLHLMSGHLLVLFQL